MPNFETHILAVADGSWDRFEQDWRNQCQKGDSEFDEYAPTSLRLFKGVVDGTGASLGPLNTSVIAALWDNDTEHYYLAALLNRAGLPGWDGRVLRVREMTVSPLIDCDMAAVAMYPDVIIGILNGVFHLAGTSLGADHIHMNLRSPADKAFFAAFGTAFGASGVATKVETKGSWLYVTL